MEPFVALMRRYCIDYTARHDLTVCDDIMVPEYTLHMGGHLVAGRDEAYKPAAAAQFRQFPGLCLTVNEIICSGARLALRFSEHGASRLHGGAQASWGGIGLYRWDGQRLTENFVEQDYFSRRHQLSDGMPEPAESPAIAPWDTPAAAPAPEAEEAVRAWLIAGDITGVTVDDGREAHRIVAAEHTEIDDLFSAGNKVAFHAVQYGSLAGDDPAFPLEAAAVAGEEQVSLHIAGIVTVAGGQVVAGRVIRDRHGLARRLATEPAGTPGTGRRG